MKQAGQTSPLGELRNTCKSFSGKPEGWKPLQRTQTHASTGESY